MEEGHIVTRNSLGDNNDRYGNSLRAGANCKTCQWDLRL